MSDLVNVKGLADLQKFLDQLAPKMEANVMRGALRAGMKEVKPEAVRNINSQSGELAKGLKIGTRSRGKTVYSTLKVKGKHAFIGHMLEFTGARAHEIKPRKMKSLFIAGVFGQIVQHPGFRARPFLRPALDVKASAAVVSVGNYIKNRLATKQGLDTSHIKIEGDE
jgi:hypothetical protein